MDGLNHFWAPTCWMPFLIMEEKMKTRIGREICKNCGKERPVDPRKHLCHECWQEEKDREREAYYENHFGQTPPPKMS